MKTLFRITVKTECLDVCLDAIKKHTLHCKSEPGNLVSEAFQDSSDPRVIYLISEWDSEEHELMHVNSEADAAFVRFMDGKEDAPPFKYEWTQLA